MRIPLLRFKGDTTPIADWEKWWAPVIVPVTITLLLLILPVIMIIGYGAGLAHLLAALFLPRSVRARWLAKA
jgi:hypothetical protein